MDAPTSKIMNALVGNYPDLKQRLNDEWLKTEGDVVRVELGDQIYTSRKISMSNPFEETSSKTFSLGDKIKLLFK